MEAKPVIKLHDLRIGTPPVVTVITRDGLKYSVESGHQTPTIASSQAVSLSQTQMRWREIASEEGFGE
eukprot:973417-Rhodomonas_salina.2